MLLCLDDLLAWFGWTLVVIVWSMVTAVALTIILCACLTFNLLSLDLPSTALDFPVSLLVCLEDGLLFDDAGFYP